MPDAQLDAHPFATWLLELGFDAWLCTVYRREVLFPPDFHIRPGTLVASNHQRDVDGPMLGTVLVRRRGLRFEWPLPFYATREDLFQPGILARLTVHWPKLLSMLLGHVSLAWFFPLGRAEPMRRTREFTLGDALQTLADAGLGERDAASLLNARGRRETGLEPGAATVDETLARPGPVLDHWWGLRRLGREARTAIAGGFRATVRRQLEGFALRLDRGRCVYFAPEGSISTDGRFGRVRAGFYRLCRMTQDPPWIQPIALGYDSLAPGRTRVVIRIGEAFRADVRANRRGFDTALRDAIVGIEPLTPSHLLARFLLHGPRCFTADDLATWLERGHATLAAGGVGLDPLFARESPQALAHRRLRWLQRKRLVARDGDGFRNTCPRDVAPGWRQPAAVARFMDNRLGDVVPGVDTVLPC